MGGDVSLRQMMEKNPILFRDILLADGIVSETDLPKYFTSIGGTDALIRPGRTSSRMHSSARSSRTPT